MVTLREVAARAGVSVRTVSNVVNDYEHVAPHTRETVRAALDELGYRPNLAARQLRQGRTGMLALVVPELHSPYFAELASAIVGAADERGWVVLVEETAGELRRERALLGRSGASVVDGIVVSPWALEPDDLARRDADVPVVLLGERGADDVADRVAIDNVRAGRDATAHLAATGRRRIAAIGVQPHLRNGTAAQRLAGHRQALAEAGLPADPHREITTERLHRGDGADGMARLLDAAPGVDAVFCFTDEIALGAARTLADRGRRVPDDVALVGFDDIEDARYAVPSLTTIAPDKDRIAAVAIDCLLARITDPDRRDAAPVEHLLEHRLIVRQSTAGSAR